MLGEPSSAWLITSPLSNFVLERVHFQGGSVGDLSTREKKSSVTTHGKTSFNRLPLSSQNWLVVLFTQHSYVVLFRFSVFVKTGSENYMLGKVNFPIQEVDQLTIVVGHHLELDWHQMSSCK